MWKSKYKNSKACFRGWEGEHDDAVFGIENNADWLGFNNNKQIFHTFSLIN